MTNLPCDPIMLMSFLNTKLRDGCDSLADLCDSLDAEEDALSDLLKEKGLSYDAQKNRVEIV